MLCCAGHMIDGRVLFPAAGYLVLAWRTLARLKGTMYQQLPVVFENICIHRATIMPHTGRDDCLSLSGGGSQHAQ